MIPESQFNIKTNPKQKQDSSDQQSDSLGSKQLQQIEEFHSDQSWAQLDDLQQHLFNGSYEQQTPQTQPKKPKKKQQQATKMLQIQQEEKWLQKFRKNRLVEYRDPLIKQELSMNEKKVVKALQQGINNSISINSVTKMMGIKPVKILNKWKINEQFQSYISYIQTGQIPENILQEFKNFMEKDSNDNEE